MWQPPNDTIQTIRQFAKGEVAPDTLDELTRLALVRYFGEARMFPPEAMPRDLVGERERINSNCFNFGRVSPESLIRRAMRGGIGFLDLFAYHERALNPAGIKFAQEHPNENFVSVGLEFNGGGSQSSGQDSPAGNEFCVNYDAYLFLRRQPNNSVRHVNIDFPSTGLPNVEGEASNVRVTLRYLGEAQRVLRPEGTISLYVPPDDKSMYRAAMLRGLGYSQVTFPPRTYDGTDFLWRRDHFVGQVIKLVGTV